MPVGIGVGPTMTTLNKILAIAGVALLLGGLALGFRSVSADETSCGSVFQPARGITPMACDGRLNSSATLVTVLMIVGGVGLAAAIALKVIRDRVKI
ncbi:hypothetical protein F1D05_29325 [Kribbella qitaiheensis]|uniref:Uncharacterized protein n=1 Tax=Kribbella qitaiheensis TaxID=1544730 RepID=A0A7G6X4U8_9ACTN|nr:hypothetical protein [Kribbella qitaiheensis]QNE21263.1 hypothetical protein F1D05_29325 [Kribbella qitaiheensis]